MTEIDKILATLDEDFEYACRDKAELFDFYHDRWDTVIRELRRLRRAKCGDTDGE